MSARVDIVIVNWNSGRQLSDCLLSIAEHGGSAVARVVVVDNGSTDGSHEVDVPALPLEVIATGRNLGFAAACNLGARQGGADYVLFLNPDAELKAGTLDGTLAYMGSPAAARVGICGVRLIGEDGRTQRHCARFPSLRTFVGQSFGLQGKLGFPAFTMTDFDHRTDRDVDQVIGAYFFVRRALFDALAGFDERFFVYYEELDFSLRARRAGWTTRYLAGPVGFHRGGGTTDQVKAHRLFYVLRSRLLYAFKNLGRPAGWAVLALTLLVEPAARVAQGALRLSAGEIVQSLRGFRMLLADLPRTLRTARGRW